jgi:protein-tyrosine phosphatase
MGRFAIESRRKIVAWQELNLPNVSQQIANRMTQTTAPSDSSRVENASPTDKPAPSRRLRKWVVAVLVVAAAIFVWDEYIKYRVIAKRWGVVTAGKVYRSGQVSKWMLEKKLKEHGIQVVIDMNGIEADDEHQEAEIATVARMGLEHHRFKLGGDGTGDIRNYANAIEVIHRCEQQGRPVLVHCSAGAQRTGGVVAFYRVLILGQSPKDAYAELSKYGWKAYKNQALLEYLNGHMQELADLLIERGVIASVPNPLPVVEP